MFKREIELAKLKIYSKEKDLIFYAIFLKEEGVVGYN